MYFALAGFVALIVIVLVAAKIFSGKPISEFGTYRGSGGETYKGYLRSSDYLTLPDGTRIAYDLILPANKGKAATMPLPVLFKYTPYGRAWTVFDKNGKCNIADLEKLAWYETALLRIRTYLVPNGNVLDPLWRTKWLGDVVKAGYAVVVAERPGTGASFGTYSSTDTAMSKEANGILDWIASQQWCDGKIAMFGDSVQAQVQFAAASTGNPHLKALFAESTWIDIYRSFMYPGGIYDKGFGEFYLWSQRLLDSSMITPVDSDKDGSQLAKARSERQKAMTAVGLGTVLTDYPFRDSPSSSGNPVWDNMCLAPLLDKINATGIPVYLINGWYDPLARENFLLFENLRVPKRLLVRNADHGQADDPGKDLDYSAEALRWFDYWLKGIDNGIMKEAPIRYYLQGADAKSAWKSAETWPPSGIKSTTYFFGASEPGKVKMPNGGSLLPAAPDADVAANEYRIDYSTTTGKKARWTAVNWVHEYPDLAIHDAKSVTYTTDPLTRDTEVIGHPIVRLWLCSDAPDLDLFAYLEEIDAAGRATYVTEGMLRASHRALAIAPYDYLGLPYHSHAQSDLAAIPKGEPIELVFDLLPTAHRFQSGKRIRITLSFADEDNFATPIIDPAPKVLLFRDASHPSRVELPLH